MNMHHPPQQDRSRRTEQRLLQATLALLQEGGLGACTVPAVAERAGVAVGSVYRRYPDKQAMVSAAILALASVPDEAVDQYAAIVVEAADLEDFLSRLTLSTIKASLQNRTLLVAIREFVRSTTDEVWLAEYRRLHGRARTVILAAAVERFGPEISEGEPALRLSVATIYGTVAAVFTEPQPGLFVETPTPEKFAAEMGRMQARYLRA